jgi:hypothetical protein
MKSTIAGLCVLTSMATVASAETIQFPIEQVSFARPVVCAPIVVSNLGDPSLNNELRAELMAKGIAFTNFDYSNFSATNMREYSKSLKDGTLVVAMGPTTSKVAGDIDVTLAVQDCVQNADIRIVNSAATSIDTDPVAEIRVGVATPFSGIFNHAVCQDKFDEATTAKARVKASKIIASIVAKACAK